MERIPPSNRRLDWHYIAMQAGYWAMFASIVAFQASLLLERGFTNTENGLVVAVRCGAGILLQPLLGGFSDRHPNIPLKLIFSLSMVLSLVAGVLFATVPMGLAGTLVVFAVVGGFEVSAYPLMDSMALQYISVGVPIRYSLGRGVGSMAYAITCALLGIQVARVGVESSLITHALLVVAVIALCITYPTFRAPAVPVDTPKAAPQSVLSLLKSNPRFTLMLIAMFLSLTACLPMANFLINILQAKGGSIDHLGLAFFLMGASELPTAFFFPWLMRKFGSGKLLLFSALFVSLKSALLFFVVGWPAALAVQPLQMLGYGLFTPAAVFFVDESVPAADRVRGQSIMMVASNGLGGMVGGMAGGILLDVGASTPLGGGNLLLLACAALGIVAALLAAVALKQKRTND